MQCSSSPGVSPGRPQAPAAPPAGWSTASGRRRQSLLSAPIACRGGGRERGGGGGHTLSHHAHTKHGSVWLQKSPHLAFQHVQYSRQRQQSLLWQDEAFTTNSISISIRCHCHCDHLRPHCLPVTKGGHLLSELQQKEKEEDGEMNRAPDLRYPVVHLDKAGQWLRALRMMQGLLGPIQSR